MGWFPLTGAGLLVCVGCGVALVHYGFGRIDLVLLAVGAIGLGLTSLMLLFTCLGAALTWRWVRRASAKAPREVLRLECGYPASTGFSVPSLWYLPFVHVEWRWREPEASVRLVRRGRRLHEEIRPRRRGAAGGIARALTVGDIFGLSRISFAARQRRSVQFLPWTGALKQMHVVRGMSGGEDLTHPEGPAEGDRYDLRRYVPGDPVRFVLWKVFAKSRDLVVRTPEQAIAPVRQTVAYLVGSHDDEAAAGACRVAVDAGALGAQWKLGADGCSEVAESRSAALDVLIRSAAVTEEQGGAGLASFLERADGGAVGRAVVFVPGTPGPWLDRVVAAARTIKSGVARVEFVVGTDGIHRGVRPGLWSRLWLGRRRLGGEAPVAEGTDHEDVSTVVRALSGARLNVVVVDRPNGRVFTGQHLGMMRS